MLGSIFMNVYVCLGVEANIYVTGLHVRKSGYEQSKYRSQENEIEREGYENVMHMHELTLKKSFASEILK